MKNQASRYFRLINSEIAGNCFATIQDFVVNGVASGKVTTVTVAFEDKSDKTRSKAQNRLYWLWLNYIEEKTGTDNYQLHCQFKHEFLAGILAESDGELASMFEALRNYKRLATASEYEPLQRGVIALLSTTKASIEQMTRYLGKIEVWAFEKGYSLPIPPELEWIKADMSISRQNLNIKQISVDSE